MTIIFSLDEITNVAKQILATPSLKKVITFHAQMGAGKTTLIKELVKELGVKDNSSSPTFSLVNEYRTFEGEIVYHFDLYRLKSVEEAYDFGIEEYLDNGYLSIIEWPEIYTDELEGYDFHEMIITNTESGREIEFN